MSLLNQPSRILITSDDLEWGTGQNFNMTLPEPVVGAKGVDCARAVIPNTQYPIPDYQNKFYYSINGVIDSVVLTNNRNFTTIDDLITQLNADATTQGKPVSFSYNSTTNRITASFPNIVNYPHVVVDNTNNTIATAGYSTFLSVPLTNGVYTPSAFATMVGDAFQTAIRTVSGYSTATCVGTINGSNRLVLTFTNITNFQGFIGPLSPGAETLLGYNTGYAISITSNNPFTFAPGPVNIQPADTVVITPRTQWPTKFSLNTRLGFPYAGLTATISGGTATVIGTFLPNIVRTRVIYVLSNISVNDSISTDGLRNVLAKVPVNSQYGGFTTYNNYDFNFCKIVQSSYQNIEVSLLDENYEPYNLQIEEPTELEFVFAYGEVNNGF
jgi:hypothetical protein